MLTTHFKHIVQGQLVARDNFFRVGEMFVLLVQFAEFTLTTRFSPKVFCKGVDQTILVVDRHTIGAVGGQGVHHKWTGCKSHHFVRHIDIGAQRIPAGGVVKNIVVVTLYQQVVLGPALVTHMPHTGSGRKQVRRFELVKRAIHSVAFCVDFLDLFFLGFIFFKSK